ncbi:hypothetical protein D3C86_1058460 [compost metagenome]
MLGADHAAAVGGRVLEGFVEHLRWQLGAERFEDRHLIGVGQAGGGHFRVLEVTAGTRIGTVEQLLVGPFEIQQQRQGLAHAHILEHRAAQVEDESLHACRIAVGNLFLDQSTFGDCRSVVGVGPVLRGHFQPVVELPGLERFQGHGVVAVVIGGHHVEVVETAIDRQVLAPVVLDPLVTHRASGLHFADLVRTAAQRDLQVALVEVAVGPPMLGQHRQLAEDQRQLAVVGVLELEQHGQRVFGDHFSHVAVVAAVHRRAVLGQHLEAEHHVLGAYRMAIMEACFGAQVEAHPGVVRGFLDQAGDQAVLGERLVQALLGQGVVDVADIVRRHAFADERVEAVEAAETGLTENPALGRVRVDVVEVFEIGRVFRRFVIQGHGMLRGGAGQPGEQQTAGLQEQGTDGFH